MKLKSTASKIKKSNAKGGLIKKVKSKNFSKTKLKKKTSDSEKNGTGKNNKKLNTSPGIDDNFEMDAVNNDNSLSGFGNFEDKNARDNSEDTVDEESYDEEGEDNDDIDYYDRENQEEDDEDDDNSQVDESEKHMKSLKKLKETDPDFYKFLKENDKKLLEFKASDEESDSEEDETENIHRPPEKLEVDSEESDFEAEEGHKKVTAGNVITMKMVNEWQNSLRSHVSITSTLTDVVMAFHAAMEGISGEDKEPGGYRVDGSAVFNAVIQMCVIDLPSALVKFLRLPQGSSSKVDPSKSKRWVKVKSLLKSYFTDLLKLLGGVTSSNILIVLLKHLHQLSNFLAYFHNITRHTLKMLITLWSSSDETVRVVAFLCILRLVTSQQKALLDSVLRKMYVSFIKNSKFVSVSTLPDISFMRRSLSELFTLDQRVSYQHAFLYIRQLAIHLRNAVTLLHKKEHIQAVCNWQFMNSLRLWTDVLCLCSDKSLLGALQYPLIQIIIGCIKLVPSAQYLPLRFHCCELLTKFTRETGTFIPVLPFILEALTLIDYNKRNKKVSMKPMDFTCVLRISKTAMVENGFKDANIEHVYQLLIEYTTAESYRLSFPDVVVPAIVQLRSFLKTCKVSKYTQKLKQALNKIEETAKVVEAERQKVVINLAAKKAVEAFETRLKVKGTPLTAFYENWMKLHMHQMAKRATNNEKIGEYKLPSLKKQVRKEVTKPVDDEGEVELFPSDDSDDGELHFGDDDDLSESPMKKMRKKQKQEKLEELKKKLKPRVKPSKKQNVKGKSHNAVESDDDDNDEDDLDDIVDDFHMSDLE